MAASTTVAGAGAHIWDGEAGFGLGGERHGFLQRTLADRAAIEDAGLVEVDMAFDEAGKGEPAAGVIARRVGGDAGRDLGDKAVGDADVDRDVPAGKAGIADDEVERHSKRRPWIVPRRKSGLRQVACLGGGAARPAVSRSPLGRPPSRAPAPLRRCGDGPGRRSIAGRRARRSG